MLPPHDRTNFATLSRAFDAGHVALVEVQRVSDGSLVSAICAIGRDDNLFLITPFATLIEGDPFELFSPPNPEGGFHSVEDGHDV